MQSVNLLARFLRCANSKPAEFLFRDLRHLDVLFAGELSADEAEEIRIGEYQGLLEVIGKAQVAARDAHMLEAEAAVLGEEEEFPETEGRVGEEFTDGGRFFFELTGSTGGEADEQDALHRVLVKVEHVGVFEEEGAGLEGSEGGVAARKSVESGDGHRGAGVIEDKLLQLERAADFLLGLHVVIEAVVTYAEELLGYVSGGFPPLGGGGRGRYTSPEEQHLRSSSF